MSIELEPEDPVEYPAGYVWRPEWIPPPCPAGCINGCEPLYGITIYEARPHFGHSDNDGNVKVICAAIALEYYFDKYGCRRIGPPPRRDDPATIVNLTVIVKDQKQPTIEMIWNKVKRQLQGAGAPKAGHVRLLPKWRDGLTYLAGIRGYLR